MTLKSPALMGQHRGQGPEKALSQAEASHGLPRGGGGRAGLEAKISLPVIPAIPRSSGPLLPALTESLAGSQPGIHLSTCPTPKHS